MPGPITNVGTAVEPAGQSLTIAATKGVDSNYQIILSVAGDEALMTKTSTGKPVFPIIANLGEKYNMEFSSTWDSPFSKSSVGSIGEKITGISSDKIDNAVNAAGFGTKLKGQSAQVWSSSSPMEFSFELQFNAIENPASEIRDRHIALLKLVAPSEIGDKSGNGMFAVLKAPGPSILRGVINQESRRISLQVGNYMLLDNVVVESVSSDVTALCNEAGIPIQIVIACKIKSFFSCFTTSDIDKMFNFNKSKAG